MYRPYYRAHAPRELGMTRGTWINVTAFAFVAIIGAGLIYEVGNAVKTYSAGVEVSQESLRRIDQVKAEVKDLQVQVSEMQVQLIAIKESQGKNVIRNDNHDTHDRNIEKMIREMWERK